MAPWPGPVACPDGTVSPCGTGCLVEVSHPPCGSLPGTFLPLVAHCSHLGNCVVPAWDWLPAATSGTCSMVLKQPFRDQQHFTFTITTIVIDTEKGFLFFFERVSHIPWPKACYIAKGDPEFLILLPSLPQFWDYRCVPLSPVYTRLFAYDRQAPIELYCTLQKFTFQY